MHRSAIRYHGGKYRLAPWIISHFVPHRVYTEVYGGAAGVLLRKPPAAAEVYNDLDGEIVNFFRVLRNPMQARELERLLRLTPYTREEHELSSLSDCDPIEQARRTLIRANMSFGSTSLALAISLSGGKDSQALLNVLVAAYRCYLDRVNVQGGLGFVAYTLEEFKTTLAHEMRTVLMQTMIALHHKRMNEVNQ